METLAEKHWNLRFDDLVRSERYFTATLLPAVLFHVGRDGRRGVEHFIELVEKKADTEYSISGERKRKDEPNYNFFKDVEVITEFHIARDLKYRYPDLVLGRESADESEQERRDAPDLVIVAGSELVVCEGKFFHGVNARNLNKQLYSQRRQVAYLLKVRHDLRAYRHVAIVPEKLDLCANVVLLWDDIRDLADEVMGREHYVTDRLRKAVERYKRENEVGVRYYDDILPFDAMREKCRELREQIEVGHEGGERDLRRRDLVFAEKKQWKWRERAKYDGQRNPNWMAGERWLAIVESRAGLGAGSREPTRSTI